MKVRGCLECGRAICFLRRFLPKLNARARVVANGSTEASYTEYRTEYTVFYGSHITARAATHVTIFDITIKRLS